MVRNVFAKSKVTFKHAHDLCTPTPTPKHKYTVHWTLPEPSLAESWFHWLCSQGFPDLMVNVWVAWKGCDRRSVRLNGQMAPSTFLPVLRALFQSAFQTLEQDLMQRPVSGHPHSLWHCVAHCMTRHDVISMQINTNRGSPGADWVLSSTRYLYPHTLRAEFSIMAAINHDVPLFLEVAVYHCCHFTNSGSEDNVPYPQNYYLLIRDQVWHSIKECELCK